MANSRKSTSATTKTAKTAQNRRPRFNIVSNMGQQSHFYANTSQKRSSHVRNVSRPPTHPHTWMQPLVGNRNRIRPAQTRHHRSPPPPPLVTGGAFSHAGPAARTNHIPPSSARPEKKFSFVKNHDHVQLRHNARYQPSVCRNRHRRGMGHALGRGIGIGVGVWDWGVDWGLAWSAARSTGDGVARAGR